VGDFNEILDFSEKFGGYGCQRSLMEAFQKTLEFCELFELDFRGPRFTRTNGKEGQEFIKEKLDRVVANRKWFIAHQRVEVMKKVQLHSDHCSMSIFLNGMAHGRKQWGGFKYDAAWNNEKAYQDIIKQVWQRNGNLVGSWYIVAQKLEKSKKHVLQWKKEKGGSKGTWVRKLHQKINLAQDNLDLGKEEELKNLKGDRKAMLDEEDLHCKQRARENWLKEGDQNTKKFHASATQKLQSITDEVGQ
jgi:hypothetical protein